MACFTRVRQLQSLPSTQTGIRSGHDGPARVAEFEVLDGGTSWRCVPDKVDTRLGTLNFFDGFSDKATAEKLYDNLDFQRGCKLTCSPFRL